MKILDRSGNEFDVELLDTVVLKDDNVYQIVIPYSNGKMWSDVVLLRAGNLNTSRIPHDNWPSISHVIPSKGKTNIQSALEELGINPKTLELEKTIKMISYDENDEVVIDEDFILNIQMMQIVLENYRRLFNYLINNQKEFDNDKFNSEHPGITAAQLQNIRRQSFVEESGGFVVADSKNNYKWDLQEAKSRGGRRTAGLRQQTRPSTRTSKPPGALDTASYTKSVEERTNSEWSDNE